MLYMLHFYDLALVICVKQKEGSKLDEQTL